MSILDRALRMGEGKQFKTYEKRVGRMNQWEPELELLDDDELRARAETAAVPFEPPLAEPPGDAAAAY